MQRVLFLLDVTLETILSSLHPHITFIYSPRINSLFFFIILPQAVKQGSPRLDFAAVVEKEEHVSFY